MNEETSGKIPPKENQVKTDDSKKKKKGKKRYWRKRKSKNKNLVSNGECYLPTNPETELSSLPNEIIYEILNRLEAEDVLRCKCVCKQWHALIQERHFVEQHTHRWRNKISFSCGFPIYTPSTNHTFQVMAQNYGIVVERSNDIINGNCKAKYRARNPAIRQVLDLPSPRFTTNHQISVCYDCKTNLCKLISIYYYEEENNRAGGCEILSLGSEDLSWRTLDIACLHDLDHEREKIRSYLCHQDDKAFHFIRVRYNLAQVVSINLEDECIFVNTLPEGSFSNLDNVWHFYWGKNPGFTEVVKNELHIFFLEDFMGHRFSRKTIVPLFLGNALGGNLKPLLCIEGSGSDSDSIFFWNENGILVYDIETTAYDMKTSEKEAIENITLEAQPIEYIEYITLEPQSRRRTSDYSLLSFKGMQTEK